MPQDLTEAPDIDAAFYTVRGEGMAEDMEILVWKLGFLEEPFEMVLQSPGLQRLLTAKEILPFLAARSAVGRSTVTRSSIAGSAVIGPSAVRSAAPGSTVIGPSVVRSAAIGSTVIGPSAVKPAATGSTVTGPFVGRSIITRPIAIKPSILGYIAVGASEHLHHLL